MYFMGKTVKSRSLKPDSCFDSDLDRLKFKVAVASGTFQFRGIQEVFPCQRHATTAFYTVDFPNIKQCIVISRHLSPPIWPGTVPGVR